MEVNKKYRVNQFAGNITKAMEKTSNILRFFPNQYEGAFNTKNDWNGKAVPSVFFERFMDIGAAEIQDISNRVGCPDPMDYECLLGDDFAIGLTHNITKGVKLQKCNANQYSTSTATIIQNAMIQVKNKTTAALDAAHIYAIKQTVPYIDKYPTVSKDNILDVVADAKAAIEIDKKLTHNDLGYKMVMPSFYKVFIEQAFMEHERILLNFSTLENGINVTRVNDVDIEFWDNIDYCFIATSDAWATVVACWESRSIRAFYNEEEKVTKIDQEIFTGGGYKWQWKSKIDDPDVIKNIIMIKESKPAENPAPTVNQSTKTNDGLRVLDKTIEQTRYDAVVKANQDYVSAVETGYDAEAKAKLGDLYVPAGK